MSSIILNVVIILGIIIAGGFLIFFVGDLLMSIIDPNSDERKIKNKRKKSVAEFNEKMKEVSPEKAAEVRSKPEVARILAEVEEDAKDSAAEAETTTVVPQKKQYIDENTGATYENYEDDEIESPAPAKEEKKEEEQNSSTSPVSPIMEDDDEEAGENENDRRIREAREALERRKAEILRRLQLTDDDDEDEDEDEEEEEKTEPEQVETEETETEEAETEETETEEDKEKSEEEAVEAPNASVIEEEVAEEPEESNNSIDEMKKSLEEEKQRYATMIQELQAKEKQRSEEEKVIKAGTKADYENRLEIKKKALEENEKELRACSREYKPLLKVKNTLERDEKKLRIKEAQVAKQKVALYGVNNYADIDDEKAKKLSEELDLLEGLKLSVQHCREVMSSNKDRMPVLERMYNILQKRNEELKADVENLQGIIDSFND